MEHVKNVTGHTFVEYQRGAYFMGVILHANAVPGLKRDPRLLQEAKSDLSVATDQETAELSRIGGVNQHKCMFSKVSDSNQSTPES